VLRFWNNVVFDNLHGVSLTILNACEAASPQAPPACGRG
jgi:very-short-patch-repair endonuclease